MNGSSMPPQHFRLQVAEEPGASQRAHHFRRELARLLALRRLLAQERHERLRPAHGFIIAHAREAGGGVFHIHARW
jgi:hypothetical protein